MKLLMLLLENPGNFTERLVRLYAISNPTNSSTAVNSRRFDVVRGAYYDEVVKVQTHTDNITLHFHKLSNVIKKLHISAISR